MTDRELYGQHGYKVSVEEPVFVVEVAGDLHLFPYGVGGGPGYQIERATPIKWPRWVVTCAHLGRTTTTVRDEATQLKLLKLPRNKHD